MIIIKCDYCEGEIDYNIFKGSSCYFGVVGDYCTKCLKLLEKLDEEYSEDVKNLKEKYIEKMGEMVK